MNYQKDKEYNLKYATNNGATKEVKVKPEKDMTTPEMIMKLKNDNKDFFKLLEGIEKFTSLVTDKDNNSLLLKNTSYNKACYWLDSELHKENDEIIETNSLDIDNTIIKTKNNKKFVYNEKDGTLKLLEESKEEKYPKRIKTRDGYILTKVNDGTPENADIPEYMNEYGDTVLIPDTYKYLKVEEDKERLVEDMEDTVKSEKGFYIGDPCYVLPDEIYDEIWGDKYNFKDGKIVIEDNAFIVHGTAYGDGEYFDGKGIAYGVDSGTLAIIPIELIKETEIEPNEGEYEYGRIVFGNKGSLEYVDGVFTFKVDAKEVVIDTDPAYDDYDNEDDYIENFQDEEEIEDYYDEEDDD